MSLLGQNAAAWTALAYFVSATPVGVILARIRGIDLRKVGSGNIGATNAARALGGKWGTLVFALDLLKAFVPVYLASGETALGGLPEAERWIAPVGLAAVLGHVFPIYLGFRGGKGVACAFGVYLALDWPVAVAALVMYAQGLFLLRISAVGSLTAVTAATLVMVIADKPWPYQSLTLAIAIVIWIRHAENIRRLLREAHERKRAQ